MGLVVVSGLLLGVDWTSCKSMIWLRRRSWCFNACHTKQDPGLGLRDVEERSVDKSWGRYVQVAVVWLVVNDDYYWQLFGGAVLLAF